MGVGMERRESPSQLHVVRLKPDLGAARPLPTRTVVRDAGQ